jgi:hypothetical protein
MEINEPTYFNTNVMFPYNIYHIDEDFGGEEDGLIDVSTLTWTYKDIKNIYKSLENLQNKHNLYVVNFEFYEKNKKGTKKLISDLILKQVPVDYLLGCTLYHQLLYQDPLEATFSTGFPNSS